MPNNSITMNKKIPVSFPADVEAIKRNQIAERVNNILEPINKNVSSWNAFVDFRKTQYGDFVLIAKCDNEEIRSQMQELINRDLRA